MEVDAATETKMPKPSRSRMLRRHAPRRRASGPQLKAAAGTGFSSGSSASMTDSFSRFQLAVGRAVAGFLDGVPDALRQLRAGCQHAVREDQEVGFFDDGDGQLLQLRRQRNVH